MTPKSIARELAKLLGNPFKGLFAVPELVRIAANSPIIGTLHLRYRAANVGVLQLGALAFEACDFLLLVSAGFEVAGV